MAPQNIKGRKLKIKEKIIGPIKLLHKAERFLYLIISLLPKSKVGMEHEMKKNS